MKTLTLLCNIVLVVFTVVVNLTDGPAKETAYIIFTVLLVLVPLATVFALSRPRLPPGWLSRAVAISNLALMALVVWAIVDQYPHPAEPGFVEFIAVAVATPLLSAWMLFRRRTAPDAARQ